MYMFVVINIKLILNSKLPSAITSTSYFNFMHNRQLLEAKAANIFEVFAFTFTLWIREKIFDLRRVLDGGQKKLVALASTLKSKII